MNSEITILFTSDVHGHALPILYGTNEKAELGLVKYATAVKEARRKFENVLVIDNGDLIQGTPLMTHYVKEHQDQKNPMIELMNQIKIDAGVIGNHEFNFGKETLNNAIDQSNYPWLAANIMNGDTGKPAYGPPYLSKTLNNGIKVAIVGVTTHYIPNWESPNHIKGLDFRDAFQTLKTWVQYIREKEKPDVLIAAYHGGFERDIETGEPTEALTGENQGYQMCNEIEGIDVLLTGHQHRSLVGEVNDVLILQPGNNAQGYGMIQIELEKRDTWQIINKKGKLQSLVNVEADPELLSYMEEIELSTQRWLDEPIGHIKGVMQIHDAFQARVKKHPFIQFIHDVQKEASGVNISVTALFNNSTNGFPSVVTMRDIVSNYMYPNTLTVLELTGLDIKAALEKSAEYFMIDDQKQVIVNPTYVHPKPQHYNYDIWDGIEYKLNIANPVGSRVEYATYQGEYLNNTSIYPVVLNNYRASGGGNYSMFRNKPVIKEIQKDTVEIIREYFEKHPTVEAYTIDNFTVYAN
ncbi:bifunctional metallophosphatase/5'-nucleotidase [Oceanobacillus piezotolerans]|uniref:Bifunctional metallophosphatase/5'-nucleotidase n=1 Tax=Oceanobacillus piezotolerans TaxID=2448030 RepID=A0A498D7U5_9BACI|nr:bifunctional UDP-sugar hydrolase/5'-nucleotidase [Oceanobacillus piezotolerans]RLL42124.1 bifunctional metallophosphatase/5'-nucleotidase [Oceanobacillus piezotolerans]